MSFQHVLRASGGSPDALTPELVPGPPRRLVNDRWRRLPPRRPSAMIQQRRQAPTNYRFQNGEQGLQRAELLFLKQRDHRSARSALHLRLALGNESRGLEVAAVELQTLRHVEFGSAVLAFFTVMNAFVADPLAMALGGSVAPPTSRVRRWPRDGDRPGGFLVGGDPCREES